MRGEQGPPGERGMRGNEGPEGPRGSISLWAALALLLIGFGTATGFIISGAVGKDDEPEAQVIDQANRLGGQLTFAGEFGAPGAPQPIQQNSAYAHYDVQIHSRDLPTQWDYSFPAQHTDTCGAPPGTHALIELGRSVYICNDHVMTAANAAGYGEIVLTPSQILNCSAGCTVQWNMSTEKMSGRDWPDLMLTPWDDNVTIPLENWLPDAQGLPRRGIHVTANNGGGAWLLYTVENYIDTWINSDWWVPMGEGVPVGVNQSATRQPFRLTIQPGQIKFERLSSLTAPGYVWTRDANGNPGFTACACLLASDYVVQFGHHSYNPTKDGAGIPATWHWSDFTISNATPFTLIHATPTLVQGSGGTVQFNAPAPANARLRFTALCKVKIDGVEVPYQKHMPEDARPGLAHSYFVPIAQGKTSVSVSFAPFDWFSGPCNAKDFHVWSKGGVSPPAPTPTPFIPMPTITPVPTSTPTPINTTPVPTPTRTPVPAATSTPTPVGPLRACTLRWGNNSIEAYGQLNQQDCANRGQ